MTWAFLCALAAGLVSSGILAALWKGEVAREANTARALELARLEVDVLHAELEAARRQTLDERARLETVVSNLKASIAALEADLYACNSPAVVRERLRRLLDPSEVVPPAGASRPA